jgi:hypothetical protein
MSAETQDRARVAARAYGKDASRLNFEVLIDAIKAHRTAEKNEPAPEASPTPDPFAAVPS